MVQILISRRIKPSVTVIRVENVQRFHWPVYGLGQLYLRRGKDVSTTNWTSVMVSKPTPQGRIKPKWVCLFCVKYQMGLFSVLTPNTNITTPSMVFFMFYCQVSHSKTFNLRHQITKSKQMLEKLFNHEKLMRKCRSWKLDLACLFTEKLATCGRRCHKFDSEDVMGSAAAGGEAPISWD